MLYIIVKKRGILIKSLPFEKDEILIGREIGCDIILSDPTVSRRHAILKKENDEIFIKDNESKNGTFLNGKKIKFAKIEKNDKIGIGSFEIEIGEEEIVNECTKEIKSVFFDKKEEFEIYLYRDSLTGLYSRKFFDDKIKNWSEDVFPLSILFIDIDNFKKFNDTFGHKKGDILLNLIGDFLIKNFSHVFPLRWGGEEFLIFLKNTDLKEAENIAEILRKELSKYINEKMGFKITVSIGIAGIPENAESIDEAIEKADRAMYKAKMKGKDRVAIYEGE
ncbi:MAG: GGDEF domain-containing protein [candidate division WOR-3 bacterium]